MGTEAQFPNEQSATGAFQRQEDAFREKVSPDAAARYAPAAGRYHLYISLACPWASRTLIVPARDTRADEEAIATAAANTLTLLDEALAT